MNYAINVHGDMFQTFRIIRYIAGVHCQGVSVKRGSTVVPMIGKILCVQNTDSLDLRQCVKIAISSM